ncbi:MAG: hypothetical protein U0525_05765 [Patescibacteria group bacterium]
MTRVIYIKSTPFLESIKIKSQLVYLVSNQQLLHDQAAKQLNPMFFNNANNLSYKNNKLLGDTCGSKLNKLNSFTKALPDQVEGRILAILKSNDDNKFYIVIGNENKYFISAIHIEPEDRGLYWNDGRLESENYLTCGIEHPNTTGYDIKKGLFGDLTDINILLSKISEKSTNSTSNNIFLGLNAKTENGDKKISNYTFDKNFIPLAYSIDITK